MKQAPIEVRNSPVHGSGVFALGRIRKGSVIIEYLGDRVSHEEVDERYADKLETDSHTFLFTVNSKIVIDAGSNGNDARFINHSCDPNCESTIKNTRVFIEAIRTIQPGEELNYDYAIGRDADDAANVDEIFACRCGAANCRGNMLEPRKTPRKRRKGRAVKRSAAGSRGKAGARGKTGARGTAVRGKRARGKKATRSGTATRSGMARRSSAAGRGTRASRSKARASRSPLRRER
jgi:hypothetical protein